MIDWKGLFAWSTKYKDGTAPTLFSPMLEEERKWLEEALSQYTFNEVNRMKEIISPLVDHKNLSESDILKYLDEMLELIDHHERNSSNLEKLGGFKVLMDIMFNNPHSEVRKLAMLVFSTSVQNNEFMQEAAHKHGGLELMYQYIKEENEANKDQVIGAFSSLIRTAYTPVKAEFFSKMKGLDWISLVIIDKSTSKKTLRKIYFLLYDLIVKETDKGIDTVLYQDNLIKDYIVKNKNMISKMLETIEYGPTESLMQDHVLREFVLN